VTEHTTKLRSCFCMSLYRLFVPRLSQISFSGESCSGFVWDQLSQ